MDVPSLFDVGVVVETKRCIRCGHTKPLSDFPGRGARGTRHGGKDGKRSVCWSCRLDVRRGRKRRENRRIARRRKHDAVELRGRKCEHCGLVSEYDEVYDFHHIDPDLKRGTPSLLKFSKDKFEVELSKCVMICSNCHRIEHAKDRKARRNKGLLFAAF